VSLYYYLPIDFVIEEIKKNSIIFFCWLSYNPNFYIINTSTPYKFPNSLLFSMTLGPGTYSWFFIINVLSLENGRM
jgi:hypothetical protein